MQSCALPKMLSSSLLKKLLIDLCKIRNRTGFVGRDTARMHPGVVCRRPLASVSCFATSLLPPAKQRSSLFPVAAAANVIIFWSGLVLCPSGGVAKADNPEKRPPNVVLLVADDLGSNDLGCYGRKDQHTPALDRLASDGVLFKTAYSSASVCSPSRAALLSGQHPARLNLTAFLPGRSERSSHRLLAPVIAQHLPDGVLTLAALLKTKGYASMCIGKWHLGGKEHGPIESGFDQSVVGHSNPGAESPAGGKGELRDAAEAVAFIESHKESPFLLYVAFNSPHIPLAAPSKLVERHAQAFHPTYAAAIESLDSSVGQIMAALERNQLAADTLLVFTSDNGGLHVPEGGDASPTFNRPFRAGKGFLYEGGIRVPLIMRLPGVCPPGLVVDAPVSLGDLVPTICHLAGAAAPQPCDFQDISPLLVTTPDPRPPVRSLFWHQPHYTNQGGRPAGAIREGDWKLIEHYEDGRLELFNLAQDSGEEHDVSDQDPARVAAMRGRLEAWRRSVSARNMSSNPDFNKKQWAACYTATDVSLLKPAATAVEMLPALVDWRRAMVDQTSDQTVGRDSFLLLKAQDAKIEGQKLCYEAQPEKDTLGCWVNPADTAAWDITLAEPGVYRITLLVGCGNGNGGSTVGVSAGEKAIEFTVKETGHFQRFVPIEAGQLSLVAGKNRLVVRPVVKKAAAVMDLRNIQLERVN